MALGTYSDLKGSIKDWLARSSDTGLDAVVDDFIDMAEAGFNRELRILDMEASTTLTTVSSVQTVALPSDLHQIIELRHNTDPKRLDFTNRKQITDTLSGQTTGRPTQYARRGDTIVLGPIPDSTYTLDLDYFQKITALSDTATTNFILTTHPDLYLFASLVEAADYVEDEGQIARWRQKKLGILQEIKKEDRINRLTQARAGMHVANKGP